MRPSRLALLAVVLLLTVGGCATHSSFAPAAGSWIDPAATGSGPLLFISDLGDYSVDVYSIPNLKLVEKIRGFNEPEGECSDAHGNVWIVNEDPQEILEFKPGSKSPIATLDDPTGSPVACAVNLHDGDLAVTSVFNGSGPGGVLVYKGARGTPRAYLNPNQFYYYFAGYDSHGNLYASGLTSKNAYSLSLLRAGAKSMSSISISGGTLYFPGAVFFSGSSTRLRRSAVRQQESLVPLRSDGYRHDGLDRANDSAHRFLRRRASRALGFADFRRRRMSAPRQP